MIDVSREIFDCWEKNKCLKGKVDCKYPEAFLGNPNAKFAIVGTNPGPRKGLEKEINNDFNTYLKICGKIVDPQEPKEFRETRQKWWPEGYLATYELLTGSRTPEDLDKIFSQTSIVKREEPLPRELIRLIEELNQNVIILNLVKCSTKKWSTISAPDKKEAMKKCKSKSYLPRQLAIIQPKIVLAHGRPAVDFIIEMLRKGTNYDVDSSSCDLSTLAELNLQNGPNVPDQNRLSYHWVSGTSKEGQKTLFLFNTHLSYPGIAKHNLELNLIEKQKLVKYLQS